MEKKTCTNALAAMLAVLTFAAAPAQATSITYTLSGFATATITTGTNTVSISLTDLYVNPTDVTDNVSALMFTLSSTPTSDSISSSSASTVNVTGPGYTTGSSVAPGWALSLVGATTKLDDLGAGGAGPAHTLIGAPGSGGYTNAGGSIAGNGPHNDFLSGTATWTLTEAGVTSATTVTAATFQFGTTDGSNQSSGVQMATPEPSTAVTFGIGVMLLTFSKLRRKSAVR